MNRKIFFVFLIFFFILVISFYKFRPKGHSFDEIVNKRALFFQRFNNNDFLYLKNLFTKKKTVSTLISSLSKDTDLILLPENSGFFREIRGNLFDLTNEISSFFVLKIGSFEEKGFFSKKLMFNISDIEKIDYNYRIKSWDFDIDVECLELNRFKISCKKLSCNITPVHDTEKIDIIVSPEIDCDIYLEIKNIQIKQKSIRKMSFGNIYSFENKKSFKKDTNIKLIFKNFQFETEKSEDFSYIFKPIRSRDFRIDLYNTTLTKGKLRNIHNDYNFKVIFPYEKKVKNRTKDIITVEGRSNFNNLFTINYQDFSHLNIDDNKIHISRKLTEAGVNFKEISIYNSLLKEFTGTEIKNKEIYLLPGYSGGIIEYPIIQINPKTLYRKPDGRLLSFKQTLKKNLLHEFTHLYTGKVPHYNPYFYEGLTTFIEFYIYSGLYNIDLTDFIDENISKADYIDISHGKRLKNLILKDDPYYSGGAFFYSSYKEDNTIIKKILNKKAPAKITDALDI